MGRGPSARRTHIPLADVASRVESEVPDRDTSLLVHCLSGVRSARAAKLLNELGYRDVVNLKPISTWRQAGGDVGEPAAPLARSSGADTAARCSSPKSDRRASAGCWMPRCC